MHFVRGNSGSDFIDERHGDLSYRINTDNERVDGERLRNADRRLYLPRTSRRPNPGFATAANRAKHPVRLGATIGRDVSNAARWGRVARVEQSQKLAELVSILSLERIEENIFRGQSQDLGWGRVFGGQVVGQALSAAEQTVPEGRSVHSLHAYFLRPGDASKPILYLVDPIRDGKSFTTRRVVAVQDGKAIFNLAASFQIEEPGFDHQAPTLPDVPPPEGLPSETTLGAQYLATLPEERRAQIPKAMVERITGDRPIDVRPVDPVNPHEPGVRAPVRQVWFRTNGRLPDAQSVHQYMLAYASDFHFLVTAMQPHAVTFMTPGIQLASLDHAMWFHRPFRFDEWMLYDIDAPSAQNARGVSHGRWFCRDGRLVASTMQEGLMRDRR